MSQAQSTKFHVDARINIANEWITAAYQVTKRTKNDQALELLRYVKSNGAIGIPTPGETISPVYMQPPDDAVDYFYITPLLPNDKQRLEASDHRLELLKDEPPVVARFAEGTRAIYLSPKQICLLGKGIILLHELTHTTKHPSKEASQADEHSLWEEEAEVLQFEFELLESLLGTPYRNALDQYVEGGVIGDDMASQPKIEKLFTERLGAKEGELDVWLTVFERNVIWRHLQAKDQDPKAAFVDFLSSSKIFDDSFA